MRLKPILGWLGSRRDESSDMIFLIFLLFNVIFNNCSNVLCYLIRMVVEVGVKRTSRLSG